MTLQRASEKSDVINGQGLAKIERPGPHVMTCRSTKICYQLEVVRLTACSSFHTSLQFVFPMIKSGMPESRTVVQVLNLSFNHKYGLEYPLFLLQLLGAREEAEG